jgi:hypothetical protein
MTEAQWLTSDDPEAMFRHLMEEPEPRTHMSRRGRRRAEPLASKRQLRLFACACCRLAGRDAVAVDGDEREGINDGDPVIAVEAWASGWTELGIGIPKPAVKAALLREVVGNPFHPVTPPQRHLSYRCPAGCMFGSSSRPGERPPEFCRPSCGKRIEVAWPCSWLTPDVTRLALAAYDERRADGTLDPPRLGILSDALEEAGCDSEPLLKHLRGLEWHVRGCWALDLVLGAPGAQREGRAS